MSIWEQLKHFSPHENWGHPNKVNGMLLLLMDTITEEIKNYAWHKNKAKAYCIIHCAYETSGHSANSQHYKGNAVDFHFANIPLRDAYTVVLKVLKKYQMENFVGLGLYPDWYNPGFHLDIRGYKARWSQIIGKYRSINEGLKLI